MVHPPTWMPPPTWMQQRPHLSRQRVTPGVQGRGCRGRNIRGEEGEEVVVRGDSDILSSSCRDAHKSGKAVGNWAAEHEHLHRRRAAAVRMERA